MDKKYIKLSTVKHRIEKILSAYDEQRTNSLAHETSVSSSSSNSISSNCNDDKNKIPFSYETIDIQSILQMIDKKNGTPVSAEGNRSKRRNNAKKRTSTTQFWYYVTVPEHVSQEEMLSIDFSAPKCEIHVESQFAIQKYVILSKFYTS